MPQSLSKKRKMLTRMPSRLNQSHLSVNASPSPSELYFAHTCILEDLSFFRKVIKSEEFIEDSEVEEVSKT